MYNHGSGKVLGTGAVGAGGLAFTGFDVAFLVVVGLLAIVAGLLLLRLALHKRADQPQT